MKISLNWICDFITLKKGIPPSELVQKVTLSVCEVEGYEETGTFLKTISVAEVLKINPHPNAEKLSLVTVNTGREKIEVVCGASNFKVGDKVPYAPLGAELPNGLVIKAAKIRGVESRGMLCAEDELGFSVDHEGLMLLPPDAVVGHMLSEIFPDQLDLVMEIDNKSVTHRPDLWGHYGFARELSTLFRIPLKAYPANIKGPKGEGERMIEVEVLAKELVPRFSGISADAVKIVSSPDWMRYRLSRVGLRPINNVVDITNYVMLELGQPMHAFDAQEIPGRKLTVRLAEEGYKVMTLYKKEAQLTPKNLTICDSNGPSVVAGVIGGLNSGVTDNTKSIFLEAANWDAVSIRKTSTGIGIRTDASQRFEKSLDPTMTVLALDKALELLKLTVPGLRSKGDLVDIWGTNIPKERTIETSVEFISLRLGKKIEPTEIFEILQYLGFTVEQKGTGFTTHVPSHRMKDIAIPEDLVEEIGRIHGFNNITPLAPHFPIEKPIVNERRRFEREIQTILSKGMRYQEVYNYPLTCKETEATLGLTSKGVLRLINPVAENQDQMRTSLLPYILQTIEENQKHTVDFKLYELGRVYGLDDKKGLVEDEHLALGVSLSEEALGTSFFRLKQDLGNLFAQLKVRNVRWEPFQKGEELESYQHPHISARILASGTQIGTIFSFTPLVRDTFSLKGSVCVAVMDLELVFGQERKDYHFQAYSKFPPVLFDLSLMVPVKTYYQEIHDLVYALDDKINKVEFFDLYYPKEKPEFKSLSITVNFQSDTETLSSETVKALQDKVVQGVENAGYHLR